MRLWQVFLLANAASMGFFLLVCQLLEFLMPRSTCHYLPGIYMQKKFDFLSQTLCCTSVTSPQRNYLPSCHGYWNGNSITEESMIQGHSYESEQKIHNHSVFPIRNEFLTHLWRGWLLTTYAQNSSMPPLLTSSPVVLFRTNKGSITWNDIS